MGEDGGRTLKGSSFSHCRKPNKHFYTSPVITVCHTANSFHDCQKPSFLHHTPCEGMGRVITMPCMLSTWPGLAEDREHAREHGLGVGDGSGAVLGLGRRGAIQAGAGRCWLVSLLCLGTRPVVDTTSPSRLPCSGTLGGREGRTTYAFTNVIYVL